MKRQVVIWICTLLLLGWYTSAHDCGLITNTGDISNSEWYKRFTENFQGAKIEWIMPAKAISRALMNLKSACCEGQNINNKEIFCPWYPQKPYPNSEFFYDQLLDIWLRRLDADSALAYNLEADSKGKDRRDFITKAAEEKDGTVTAKTILERRNTDRTRSKMYVDNRTNTQFKAAIEEYKDATLADRYYNMCNMIWYIYNWIRVDKEVVVDTISSSTDNSYLAQCKAMVDKRISDENLYTKIIIIKKSNELLHTTMQAYMQKYFVQEKLMVLTTLINKVKSLFSTLVQQAAVSKTCSQ